MKSLAKKVHRFLVAEDGPTAVEYAVMLALIVIVCLTAITAIGALTALYAATCAMAQREIKRVLAYSTMSQVGYMFMAVGAGTARNSVAPGPADQQVIAV